MFGKLGLDVLLEFAMNRQMITNTVHYESVIMTHCCLLRGSKTLPPSLDVLTEKNPILHIMHMGNVNFTRVGYSLLLLKLIELESHDISIPQCDTKMHKEERSGKNMFKGCGITKVFSQF